jgi:hypothetical protein
LALPKCDDSGYNFRSAATDTRRGPSSEHDGMNERQYHQIVTNRSPKRLAPLFGGPGARIVLKAAARAVRKCTAARRILDAELAPTLSAGFEIGAAGHGLLELEARDALVFAELCRKQKWLESRLRRAVPGIRKLIIRPVGWKPPADGAAPETAETAPGRSEALTE